jgi:RNA polymerase sigma-70 factor (ECF subfamily)
MTSREESSVADAVARVQGGESEAFSIVVKAYERRLLSLCLALLGDFPAAEEVTQEAFIRAFRYLDTFVLRRPFYPWLAKITVRLVQQHRSRRRTPELPLTVDIDRVGPTDHPLITLIQDERTHELWATVLELPERERAAVILFYRQELTLRETAHALGVTSGTVKTLLFRARRHLRKSLPERQRRTT